MLRRQKTWCEVRFLCYEIWVTYFRIGKALVVEVIMSYNNVNWSGCHRVKNATVYMYGGLVAKSCPTLGTPWTVAHQAPLSMGFPRQEC